MSAGCCNNSRRHNARFAYAPQLPLDGADYRRGAFGDDLGTRISAINNKATGARIDITASINSDQPLTQRLHGHIILKDHGQRNPAQAYIAIYETICSTMLPQEKIAANACTMISWHAGCSPPESGSIRQTGHRSADCPQISLENPETATCRICTGRRYSIHTSSIEHALVQCQNAVMP